MKTLIGGAVATVLGIIGLVVWWKPFLQLLAGAVPAMLVLGGALALYLGFDELKDSWKKDEPIPDTHSHSSGENADRYKQEIDELKKEIETLKEEKEQKKAL